ncbi:hypothetical protein OO015_02455 [Thermomicrobium sp. 4228-Ro]|uniref:hypothetical protein n=1 Tax=Thermomicrobium sp. 4228-Ro TaxID=2993937 RepID=UPI002248C50B|nr:hypothetical protein [Thermomicrobium sp. 4228-Ro]MCX2726354.1 hypothetical protein [Thermomicrobium sp. 4228-Ro]
MIERVRHGASTYDTVVKRFSPSACWVLVLFAVLRIAYGAIASLSTQHLVLLDVGERLVVSLGATGTLTGSVRLRDGVALHLGRAQGVAALVGDCLPGYGAILLAGGSVAAVGIACALVAETPSLAGVAGEEERSSVQGVAAALGLLSLLGTPSAYDVAPGFLRGADEAERPQLTLHARGHAQACAHARLDRGSSRSLWSIAQNRSASVP